MLVLWVCQGLNDTSHDFLAQGHLIFLGMLVEIKVVDIKLHHVGHCLLFDVERQTVKHEDQYDNSINTQYRL